MGPCAKQTVTCAIVTPAGEHFIGENWCDTPQETCPRVDGEGYEKCTTVCDQVGHAEEVAEPLLMDTATFAWTVSMDCQHALFAAGLLSFSVGESR
jgi:hypothetical protein